MANVTIRAGVNQVVYTGAAPLQIGTAPLTPTNVRFVYKTNANGQGYLSNVVAGNQALQPFKQLVATGAGSLPQCYTLIALQDFVVDGEQFGLGGSSAIDTVVLTSGAGETETLFKSRLASRFVLGEPVSTLPGTVVEVSYNNAAYISVAAFNSLLATITDEQLLAANIKGGTPLYYTIRVTKPSNAAATVKMASSSNG